MKSKRYFPFERNKYFFGKLLSVGDFEAEQKYNNNKRRAINRMLYGAGVVCGLNVLKVDDSFISVEAGFALDDRGREILVDEPVIKKLSMFEGFNQDKDPNDSSYAYLCLEYNEEEREPIHSVANNANSINDNIQYNRYREGYKLYLDYEEPSVVPGEASSLWMNTYTVYNENGICIKHVLPRYANSDNVFEFKVIIEKINLTAQIFLNYTLSLECLKCENQNNIDVIFDESRLENKQKYELVYKIKANNVKDVYGNIILNPENFILKSGDSELKIGKPIKNSTKIINSNIKDVIIQEYYSKNMDEIVNSTCDSKIYLAKILLIKAGNTYVIEKIENNPFNQYIYNSMMLRAFENIEREEMENLYDAVLQPCTTIVSTENTSKGKIKENLDVATGIEKITINNKRSGDIVFSKAITHGVGLGNVYITLGVEGENGSDIVFGKSDIFDNIWKMDLAAKADTKRGIMTIGIKLLQNVDFAEVNVRWMVVRDEKERNKDISKAKIIIKPDVCDINVRESIYLEAETEGLLNKECIWSVKSQSGGNIDENGKFTAPSVPGIYEIEAKSIENPEVKSSTFVIVREDDK